MVCAPPVAVIKADAIPLAIDAMAVGGRRSGDILIFNQILIMAISFLYTYSYILVSVNKVCMHVVYESSI